MFPRNNAKILKKLFINHKKIIQMDEMKLLEEQFPQVIFYQFKDSKDFNELWMNT